jgi:hypothetical protein
LQENGTQHTKNWQNRLLQIVQLSAPLRAFGILHGRPFQVNQVLLQRVIGEKAVAFYVAANDVIDTNRLRQILSPIG